MIYLPCSLALVLRSFSTCSSISNIWILLHIKRYELKNHFQIYKLIGKSNSSLPRLPAACTQCKYMNSTVSILVCVYEISALRNIVTRSFSWLHLRRNSIVLWGVSVSCFSIEWLPLSSVPVQSWLMSRCSTRLPLSSVPVQSWLMSRCSIRLPLSSVPVQSWLMSRCSVRLPLSSIAVQS